MQSYQYNRQWQDNKNQMDDRLNNINHKIYKSTIQIQKIMSQISPIDRQIPTSFRSRIHPKHSHNQFANPQENLDPAKQMKNQSRFKKPENISTNASSKFQQSREKFYSSFKEPHKCQTGAHRGFSLNSFPALYKIRGQIHQDTKFSVGEHLYPSHPIQSPKYPYLNTNNIQKQKQPSKHTNIMQIDHNYVVQYALSKQPLTPRSKPEQIFNYFYEFASMFPKPLIKKFKNCLYFGEQPRKSNYSGKNLKYNGFLYFYTQKIYYGSFQQEYKHGFGVQIHLKTATVYKGNFNKGHKIGKFIIIERQRTYEGQIKNGKFNGFGRLETPISIYQGQFKNGMRHGQGQQYFIKSGLKLKGIFQMDKFQNNKETSKTKQSNLNLPVKYPHSQKLISQKRPSLKRINRVFQHQFQDSSQQQQKQKNAIFKNTNMKWTSIKKRPDKKFTNWSKIPTKFQSSVMEQASDDDPLPSPFRKNIYNK